MGSSEVRLVDIDPLDLRELQGVLPQGSFRLEREEMNGTEHGDLGVTAVLLLVVGPAAIKALSAWLVQKRSKKKVSLSFEKVARDGTTEKRIITVDTTSSDPAGKDIIESLVKGLDLDPQVAAAAIKAV